MMHNSNNSSGYSGPSKLKPIINPNYTLTWDKPVLIIDDFLQNIDEFREQLLNRGGFLHSRVSNFVPNVGPNHDWRQKILQNEISSAFVDEIKKIMTSEKRPDVFTTNILYSDMNVEGARYRATHYPHSDLTPNAAHLPVVFNLWLHDGPGGTAFYTYDDYYSSSAMPEELRYFADRYIDAELEGLDLKQRLLPYKPEFLGNSEWKLWHLAQMKKNRAFVYCGDLWHRAQMVEGEFLYPNPRFSFLCFSNSPCSKFIEESGSLDYLKTK